MKRGLGLAVVLALSVAAAGCDDSARGLATRAKRASGTRATVRPSQPLTVTGRRWSGELFEGVDGFARVSARWTVPAVICARGETGDAYAWVGLGGWHVDPALEQIGTAESCYRGAPRYFFFWEFWPARPNAGDPDAVFAYPVAPGDVIDASVQRGSGGAYQVTESDTTQGWSFTRSGTSPSYSRQISVDAQTGPGNTTAEVVQEDVTRTPSDLPDYRSITFTDVTATPVGWAPAVPFLVRTRVAGILTQGSEVHGDQVTVIWRRRS